MSIIHVRHTRLVSTLQEMSFGKRVFDLHLVTDLGLYSAGNMTMTLLESTTEEVISTIFHITAFYCVRKIK